MTTSDEIAQELEETIETRTTGIGTAREDFSMLSRKSWKCLP